MNKRHYIYSLLIIILLIVAVAGWFVTDYLGNKARQEIIRESRASILTLSIYVSGKLSDFKGAVKSLAGSPWIAPALLSKGAQDIEHANSVLDRYNSALNASVSYLMDADGMTVASSNRKDPDSFVGKSCRFRPYFQESAKGQPGRYFALGVTSGKKGFYASYPVQNRLGKVLGVVTIKKDIDEMETFFSKYTSCFLISPEGIIFMSSTPSTVLKSLWPLDKAVQEQLIASRQFGDKPFEAVFLKKDFADGTEVTLKGKDYFVSREMVDRNGWSIVLLTPTDRIGIYKLIGILATISLCLLIFIFSGIIYAADRSKEAIRQSEEKYRNIFNDAILGIYQAAPDGRILNANPVLVKMYGYDTSEELINNVSVTQLYVNPEDRETFKRILSKEGEIEQYEVQLRKRSGEIFWVSINAHTVKDGKGNITRYDGTVEDINERKRSEEELRESENRYYSLFNYAVDGIAVGNAETGKLTDCNQALCRMVERDRAELIGQHQSILHPKNYLENGISTSFRVHQAGDQGQALEDRLVSKRGKIIPVEINATKIKIKGHEHLLGIFRDITERKLAEEALLSEKQLSDSIINSLPGIFYLFDDQGGFKRWNKNFEKVSKYSAEELSKMHALDFFTGEDRQLVEQAIQDVFTKGENIVEAEFASKDGRRTPYLLTGIRIEIGNTEHLVGMGIDITERKQAEEKLQTMSLTDELTGLYNRRGFFTLSQQQMKVAERTKKNMLLFFADLDKMKEINDTLGHQEGDNALIDIAAILKEVFRESDIIGRMGGDEFAILAIDTSDETREVLINRLHNTLNDYNRPEGRNYQLSLSIGIVHYNPEKPSTLDELMAQADNLMYEEKRKKQG